MPVAVKLSGDSQGERKIRVDTSRSGHERVHAVYPLDRQREKARRFAHACTQVRGTKVNAPWTPLSTFSRIFFLFTSTLQTVYRRLCALACRVSETSLLVSRIILWSGQPPRTLLFTKPVEHPKVGSERKRDVWRTAPRNRDSASIVLRFIFRGIDVFVIHGMLAWLEDSQQTRGKRTQNR